MANRGGSMKYKVEAQYTAYSQWDINFDLNKVYSWHIKYDTLEVQHKEDGKWVSYASNAQGECDYKRPEKVYRAELDEDGDADEWKEVG